MHKKLLIILVFPLMFIACKKDTVPGCTPVNPTTVASAAEVTALETYLTSKGLLGSVTLHPNKFYYKIDEAGTGATPNTCSEIKVTYEGKFTNGDTFDENSTGVSFILKQVIDGWKLGLQLIKKGGKIKLYLPPSLGYGAADYGPIPGNSILVFEVSLLDVVN